MQPCLKGTLIAIVCQFVTSGAMWCVHLSMVMAVHALRDMQGAADPRAKSAAGLKGDDGKCLAKPEPEDKDIWGACGIFKDQGRCNMRYVCHGFFQRLFPDIVRAKVHTPTTRCFVMA